MTPPLTLPLIRRGIMPILVFVIIALLILSISRLALMLWLPDGTDGFKIYILLMGIRVDFSIICTLFSPAVLIWVALNYCSAIKKPLLFILKIYLSLAVTVLLALELATPPFILEYGTRPNHIFIDYLIYPKEVFSTLLRGHIIACIVCLVISVAAFISLYKLSKKLFQDYQSLGVLKTTGILCLSLIIIPLGIRSSLGHRPLNPSLVAFTNNATANDLPSNSAFNVFYSIRHYGDNSLDDSQIYDFIKEQDVLAALNSFSRRKLPDTIDQNCPLNQVIDPSYVRPLKPNVVIILEESLGGRFFKSLGGLPNSPEIEKLSKEGWWFENMFAAGHRSIRGIEAVTAGYTPSALTSVVKLNLTKPLATISYIYQQLGYRTSFIYGGESHFDNMRTYFLNNGVDDIVEQKDYKNPAFVSSWGVSDEDLFAKADELFNQYHQKGEPFCSIVFSSSFHDPFDIPPRKVDLGSEKTPDPARYLAAKYADFAVGQFFKTAKQRDYYKNTIFVIIADHDTRVSDPSSFPLYQFSIPALIMGPGITPRVDSRVVSQIDITPTLLSLSGVSGQIPMVGQDLTKENIVERAPLAYNEIFGYRGKDDFTLLYPRLNAHSFQVIPRNKLQEKPLDQGRIQEAAAIENLGLLSYKHGWNQASCLKEIRQHTTKSN